MEKPGQPFTITLLAWGVLGLTLLLFGVWSVPETIALRNGLLACAALLLCCATIVVRDARPFILGAINQWPVKLILLLSAWVSLRAVIDPMDSTRSLGELWSQWWLPMLCGFAGMVFGFVLYTTWPKIGVSRTMGAVFWLLFSLILLSDGLYLWFYGTQGSWPYRWASLQDMPRMLESLINGQHLLAGRTGEHGEKLSYLNNTFAALVIAEIMHRWRTRTRGIKVNGIWLVVAIGLVAFCSYVLRYRNGNLALLVLLAVAGFLLLMQLRQQKKWGRLLILAVVATNGLGGLAYLYWKSDSRWLLVQATVPIAWDTERHRAWLSTALEPYPKLPDGREIDQSTYERVAWLKEGGHLILEHPLGVGINRTAFSDVLDQKYDAGGLVKGKHAHSALIDFTLQNGAPGFLLWLAFAGSLIALGWRNTQINGSTAGYFLIFLVTGYLGRSLVDSNMKDHMMQQFMFMAALFAVFVSRSEDSHGH